MEFKIHNCVKRAVKLTSTLLTMEVVVHRTQRCIECVTFWRYRTLFKRFHLNRRYMTGVLQQLDDFQLQTRGDGGCFRLPGNEK
jgi:hypothetical protein